MKYLMFLVLAMSIDAKATCTEEVSEMSVEEIATLTTDVPSHLKGATIVVRLADGKESSVPADRFKVVPRKQQFLVTKVRDSKLISCTTNIPKKNRLSLVGGHGAQEGLTTTTTGTIVEVESNVGLVGGAQYQRMLGDTFSIGVQGQTNKTGSVLIGVDF